MSAGSDFDLTLLVVAGIVLLLAFIVVVLLFVARDIRRSRGWFRTVAARHGGHTTAVPFGLQYTLDGVAVRIYALQGAVHFHAKLALREDPSILVTRIFRRARFLDALFYSPSRQKFVFHTPVDEQYSFRARSPRWYREIFDAELLQMLTYTGRVTRIEIRRRGVRGAMMMLSQSPEELAKADESVALLNRVVIQVAASALARH